MTTPVDEVARRRAVGSQDSVAIRSEGSLTICGQKRAVTLDARARRDDAGVWLEGSYALKMSE